MGLLLPATDITKWRKTPVIEEVSVEVSALGAGVAAVDAVEAADVVVEPGVANPRTRSGCL